MPGKGPHEDATSGHVPNENSILWTFWALRLWFADQREVCYVLESVCSDAVLLFGNFLSNVSNLYCDGADYMLVPCTIHVSTD